MRTHVVVADTATSSKVCPVCKTFSSSSNTTLNAHIDQCLSLGPMRKGMADSKVIKHRTKPGKTRLMVDVYGKALHCTLEDLDRRNGTNWASAHRLEAYLSARGKDNDGDDEKNGPFSAVKSDKKAIEGVDSTGTKRRILSKFSDLPSNGTMNEGQKHNLKHENRRMKNLRAKAGLSQGRGTFGKGTKEPCSPSSAESRKRKTKNSSFRTHDEHMEQPRFRMTRKGSNNDSKRSDDHLMHMHSPYKEDSSALKRLLKDHRNVTKARASSSNGDEDMRNRPSDKHHHDNKTIGRKRKLCYVSDSDDEAIVYRSEGHRQDDLFGTTNECVSQHYAKKAGDLVADARLLLRGGQETTIPMHADEGHGGNYNYYADMDPILPIPGPPGSFLPSPGRMGSDELTQGAISSSLTTCWLPYSSENKCEVAAAGKMDSSSDSPISAINSIASNSIADASTSASFTDMSARPNHVVIRLMGKDLIIVLEEDENFPPQKKAHGGDF